MVYGGTWKGWLTHTIQHDRSRHYLNSYIIDQTNRNIESCFAPFHASMKLWISIVHIFLFSFHNSDVFGLTILVRMLATTAYYYNMFWCAYYSYVIWCHVYKLYKINAPGGKLHHSGTLYLCYYETFKLVSQLYLHAIENKQTGSNSYISSTRKHFFPRIVTAIFFCLQ
jgi:hypothetical protein